MTPNPQTIIAPTRKSVLDIDIDNGDNSDHGKVLCLVLYLV